MASMLAFLEPSMGLQTLFWIGNSAAAIANIFISVYLYISHDDMKQHMIEPGELSELLNTYLPVEYGLSWIMCGLSLMLAPYWMIMPTLSLGLYNLKLFFKDKDHRKHFMTKRDYPKKEFQRIEWTYLIKSCFYGILLAVSLVYTVLVLCEYLQSFTRRSKRAQI